MDAIERYIECLSDPAVRSFKRMANHVDEEELGPVYRSRTSEEHVVAAEKELGMTLPPSYRKLVTTTDPRDKEYGLYWVWVDGLDTFGEDIVSVNQKYRDYAPPFLVAVLGTDDGDEFCFDTRHPDERGEYPIVLWNQECRGEETTEFETQATDLGEFLLGSLGGESSP
jgi:hypothetical protein